jgi:SAM-dependent methyltransferase
LRLPQNFAIQRRSGKKKDSTVSIFAMSINAHIPWQAKIAAKIFLSRLPLEHETWRRLHVFQHGKMDEPRYACEVYRQHFANGSSTTRLTDYTALELGPGDSLLSALITRAHGARATWLVDVGAFARADLKPYRQTARMLAQAGLPAPDIADADSLPDLLERCNARYETSGLAALEKIPTGAVDFVWSHAVLEYVRRGEFLPTLRQLHRVLRPGGVCSHCVDLRDHLGGRLNNLRFSERIWEHRLFSQAGFYTNRIRYREMLDLFDQAGFGVTVVEETRWSALPTPRSRLHRSFRDLDDHDLLVSGFSVVLKKAA